MPVIASATEPVASYPIEALVEDAQRALEAADWGDWELSLLLCEDAFIGPLNGQWRGKEGATDVLSFPQLDHSAGVPPEPGLLGDVVISIDTARRQAEELGHSVDAELRVLLAHGIAHLLGHTHRDDDDRARMQALEHRLLAAMDLEKPGLIGRSRI